MDQSSHVQRPFPQNKAPIVYWLGIGKLGEEAGEVNQLVGKAIAFPIGEHPDGKGPVRDRFIEELGDLLAAIDYFIEMNPLENEEIQARRLRKLAYFCQMRLSGITVL